MNILLTHLFKLFSIPARLKGVKFGNNSLIGPGYDFLFVQLKNIAIGDRVLIGKRAWMQTIENGKIRIGNGTQIGRDFVISSINEISIGSNCLFSYRVSVFDHDHKVTNIRLHPMKSGLTKGKKIIIGNDCFIGANTVITKGVKLGNHCIVGANSVVTKTFPDNSIIAGNPAKMIKRIL